MTSPQPVIAQSAPVVLTSDDFARARERWRKHATRRAWGYLDTPRADVVTADAANR